MIRAALLIALAPLLFGAGCAAEKADGRPWVRKITFAGVKHVKARDLESKLGVETTNFLHFPKHYLDPFTIDADRARIESYYRVRGWFGAKVVNAEVFPKKGPTNQPTEVDVRFSIDEGPLTKIADVQMNGFAPLAKDGDKLMREFRAKLKVGDRLDHELYLEQKAILEQRLAELGYAWAKIDGGVEVNRDTQEAVIKMTATPGPLARFGYVHVRGTERVRQHDIERHANIKWGSKFSPDDLEDARGKIYNLGLFSSVHVEYEHSDEDPTVAEVIITVKEGPFNELRLGLGIGLESQRTDAHASIVYTRRNFLKGLRTLRLRLEPAWVAIPAFWDAQRTGPAVLAEAQLTQPDWPFPAAQLKWTVGYDVGIEYAYQFHGPRTSLGLQRNFWHQKVQLGVSYNFQLLSFFNTDPTILDDPKQAGALFGYVDPYRLGWWQEDLALDLRDHPLDAHKGVYVGVTLEEGGIYALGAFQYEKIAPDLRGYLPLGSRVTLAARAQFGQIFTQGDLGSPITRRFYLGGPNSHRGFNYDRLSLQVPSGSPGIPPLPIGGDQMVLAQAELRINVVQLFKQWLSFAAFLDAGDVGAPNCTSDACKASHYKTNVDLTNLHYAVGGGLRYKTVIGTLRFDLGVRLNRLGPFEADGTPNPDPGQRFAYHISVGEAF